MYGIFIILSKYTAVSLLDRLNAELFTVVEGFFSFMLTKAFT